MPAAAVIPAPIAYIKVVAVKKLVVGFLSKTAGPHYVRVSGSVLAVKKLVVGFLARGSRSALQKVRTERPRSSLRRAVLAFSCRGRDSRRLL